MKYIKIMILKNMKIIIYLIIMVQKNICIILTKQKYYL